MLPLFEIRTIVGKCRLWSCNSTTYFIGNASTSNLMASLLVELSVWPGPHNSHSRCVLLCHLENESATLEPPTSSSHVFLDTLESEPSPAMRLSLKLREVKLRRGGAACVRPITAQDALRSRLALRAFLGRNVLLAHAAT
jgi:hypothetical protein